VETCIEAGLVGGEGFAVDASLIEADANRQRSIPGVEWKKQIDPRAASRAVKEYLATLNDAAYPSDLTDAEWGLIEPAIPPAKRGGRRREAKVREVLNAIFYVLSTGCQWQALPKDLPPPRSIRRALMRARRSRAASGIFSSTRSASC